MNLQEIREYAEGTSDEELVVLHEIIHNEMRKRGMSPRAIRSRTSGGDNDDKGFKSIEKL